jgi:DNA-nicking Smr family endonuclease
MARTAANRASALHADRAVWSEAMRDVTPLRGRGAAVLPEPRSEPAPMAASLPAAVADPRALDAVAGAGIDRATAERLKRGRRPIEARLDLHGRTQAEAHRELADFVRAAHEAGRRCVLVITGRGLGPDGPGVLKSAVPRWLAEPGLRRRVLAIAAAQPRHGGLGALYVLLRRQR